MEGDRQEIMDTNSEISVVDHQQEIIVDDQNDARIIDSPIVNISRFESPERPLNVITEEDGGD